MGRHVDALFNDYRRNGGPYPDPQSFRDAWEADRHEAQNKCKHCGAADGTCRWSETSKRARIAVTVMGADPPCAFDSFDEFMVCRARERLIGWIAALVGIGAVIALVW